MERQLNLRNSHLIATGTCKKGAEVITRGYHSTKNMRMWLSLSELSNPCILLRVRIIRYASGVCPNAWLPIAKTNVKIITVAFQRRMWDVHPQEKESVAHFREAPKLPGQLKRTLSLVFYVSWKFSFLKFQSLRILFRQEFLGLNISVFLNIKWRSCLFFEPFPYHFCQF